jgi:hypothetical protein
MCCRSLLLFKLQMHQAVDELALLTRHMDRTLPTPAQHLALQLLAAVDGRVRGEDVVQLALRWSDWGALQGGEVSVALSAYMSQGMCLCLERMRQEDVGR